MSTVARAGTTYGIRRLVDSATRVAAIQLHTAWGQTLGAVRADDALGEVEDFLRLIERPSVIKALAWDGDELVGVSFVTNELDMVSGISTEFFRARYPTETADATIWYIVAGVAHPMRPGVLDGLRKSCVAAAHENRAEVILWDASSLHREAANRTTMQAVEAVSGFSHQPIELDRVSYMALELGTSGRPVVVDLRSATDGEPLWPTPGR